MTPDGKGIKRKGLCDECVDRGKAATVRATVRRQCREQGRDGGASGIRLGARDARGGGSCAWNHQNQSRIDTIGAGDTSDQLMIPEGLAIWMHLQLSPSHEGNTTTWPKSKHLRSTLFGLRQPKSFASSSAKDSRSTCGHYCVCPLIVLGATLA